MSDANKEVIYHDDGYVIIRESDLKVAPITCPVCKFFMKSSTDVQHWEEYQCCHDCAVTFAEGHNKNEWKNGWRPDKSVIESHRQKRIKITPRLKL